MRTQPLTETQVEAKRVLERLMGLHGMNVTDLARATGESRSVMHDKVRGESRLTLDDLKTFAEVLSVEPHVFLMRADDALRWALDHPRVEVMTAHVSTSLRPTHGRAEGGRSGVHTRKARTLCFKVPAGQRAFPEAA